MALELNEAERWLESNIANAMLLRQDIIKAMMNPSRDIDTECNHPKDIKLGDYFSMYERNDIAARVNDIWPQECWKRSPILFEDDNPLNITDFEKEFDDICASLRGDSRFRDDRQEGNPIWEALREVDIRSGIGHYGVILMGLDDKRGLDQEVPGFNPKGFLKKKRNLTFLRVFDEREAEIKTVEEDPSSPRFGMPLEYALKLSKDSDTQTPVHWHRVFHVAEGDGICAPSRLESVYNRLLDLRKLLGGSAEMYWRGAFPGMTFETHPDAGGDIEIDETKMKRDIHSYMERLQRAMLLIGLTAKSHAPQVVDPTPQISAQLDAICIRINVPKRIFVGSERGELSSAQDADKFNIAVEGRRRNHVTTRLVVPFVDRMTHLGVLSTPKSYKLDWPSLNVMTDEQAASVAVKRTQAMQMYVTGGLRALIAPVDWGSRILGLPLAEAKEAFKNSEVELKKFEQRLVTALKPMKLGGGPGQAKDMTKRGERKKGTSK